MTIEKLPSGSYRVVQMYEGKRYRVTVDHKPTQKEALQLLAEAMDGCSIKGTFLSAAKSYIESRRNILSPRTIREYEFYPNRLPEWFTRSSISNIDGSVVQKCVNELAITMSPKTVRSLHGFISAVLGTAKPNLALRTALPRMEKQEPYIPTKEDYKRLFEASKGTQYHIPIQLAFHGLRRGEICALEITDLDERNYIHVTKDLVQNSNGEWIKKPPKTVSSKRIVKISKKLAEEIREQGYIFKGHPETITNYFRRTQDKLGMEHFSPHKLRHLSASIMYEMGIGKKTIQKIYGWSGSHTFDNRYSHALMIRDDKLMEEAVETLEEYVL